MFLERNLNMQFELHVQISFKERIVLLYSPKHHPFTSRLYHGFGHQHPKNIDYSRILLVFGGWRLDWKIHAFWMFFWMLVPSISALVEKCMFFAGCLEELWTMHVSSLFGARNQAQYKEQTLFVTIVVTRVLSLGNTIVKLQTHHPNLKHNKSGGKGVWCLVK